LIPGSQVQLVRKAPMGDPMEIAIRVSLLSIRSHEAERIEVQIKKN
jgi:ferrous iron transport protein A